MRKDMIAGNWKMNATHLDAIQMVQKLSYRLNDPDYERVEVVVHPPFTALRSAQTVIETDHLRIKLGAQNCHYAESGAYTGEISPGMLSKLSVSYVIVGHSERRHVFGEVDADINRKVKAVFETGMVPILAVGETEQERADGLTEEIVRGHFVAGTSGLTQDQVSSLVVAYEPVWAIGTGKTATPEDAGAVCSFIRDLAAGSFGGSADHMRILYGGSVNPGNVAAIMAKKDIDGALVGGASLDPDTFASVIRYWV
ncbi:MAG: triose-phosphate isomerase [bacterium]|nr:triose-phosphate isomerase [bacterium]